MLVLRIPDQVAQLALANRSFHPPYTQLQQTIVTLIVITSCRLSFQYKLLFVNTNLAIIIINVGGLFIKRSTRN
jgi:hypothetical protein